MIAAILPWIKFWPLALAVFAFFAGARIEHLRCEAGKSADLTAAIAEYEKTSKAALARSDALEDAVAALRKQTRTLTGRLSHETRKDSYRCPVPADGVRLLNAARTGDLPDPAGEPDGGMPDARPGTRR